jgi:hypothetical protein
MYWHAGAGAASSDIDAQRFESAVKGPSQKRSLLDRFRYDAVGLPATSRWRRRSIDQRVSRVEQVLHEGLFRVYPHFELMHVRL